MLKLKNYIELNPKEHISKGEIVRQVTMADLEPFSRDIKKCGYVKYKSGTKFRNGDTLLARITPCLENGKTSFVNFLKQNEVAVGSTEFYVLRAIEGKMDPNYLYYLSISKKFRKSLIKSMTGTSGRQRATKEAVLDYDSNIPNIDNQKTISHKLSLIDDMISVNNQINDNLLDIAKNIYHRILFSSQITKTNLRSFATVVMGQSPSSKTYNENKIGIPLLNGAADFRNGIHPSKWTTDPKIIVNKGAYIFGVRATIGLTAKVSKPYAIGRGTGSAIPKDVNNEEILYFILNDMFKKFEQTESGSVYINISKNDFENYRFNIPDRNGLLFFHEKVKPIMDQIYINKKQNKILQTIKATLLSKIF